ncbi:MAG TPA: hypothetical protein ENI63_01915, partial [Candidatus Kaiserbacteria bacterium]|nr:hypothetical protein [Candidatus Kaiserbacteria bacterium]
MLLLTKTPHKTTEKALKHAASVAEHYGFLPIESILPDYGKKKRSGIPQHTEYTSSFDNELASVIRSYIEHGYAQLTEPTLFYKSNINPKNPDKVLFGLHVIGSSHSIAEA